MRPPAGIVAAALVAVVAPALVATALADGPRSSRLEVADPREGRSLLDVREVDAGSSADALVFTVATWARWRAAAIRDRGFLMVHLDPRSGRRYHALVRSSGRGMSGILFRKRGRRDTRVGRLRVWRPDRRSVSVRIPSARLGLPPPGQHYSWRVQTLLTGARCKRVCLDRAPDAADAVETVAAPSPAPGPPPAPAPAP